MSAPVGSVNLAGSKIYPFKHHLGNQPQDLITTQLLPLKIKHVFESGDVATAVKEGVKAVGWPENRYGFAKTERYMMINHEVAPKEQALTCNSCHNGGTRLDFDVLGYTPKTTRNGRPLCASCHGDESGEWSPSVLFTNVHAKHVTDKRINCIECHSFSAAQ
jgi:hypothetical protein